MQSLEPRGKLDRGVEFLPSDAMLETRARAGRGLTRPELSVLLASAKLALDTVINTPNTRAEGFGQVSGPRLSLMASQVSDAFNTKSRVNPDVVWNGSFLPSKAELDVLPPLKKK